MYLYGQNARRNNYVLITESGDDPKASVQADLEENVSRALWNLFRRILGLEGREKPSVVYVTDSYVASNNELVVVSSGLTGDVTITLPEDGSVSIKRMDNSGNAVTISGATIDGQNSVTLGFGDGVHLIGTSGAFFAV